ncbi:MerR family transcriptional regulator [Nocardia sp. NBC_01388]|uniref:MerR family transcriptional regulator n=1 Tax=Nocardia sp. NBC_01388 TaxID=2903596 RepID=UPI003249F7CC
MNAMLSYLSIGDFSRATHMTVKTLRHYHRIGLLEPAGVDPNTGYRQYTADQIPIAQVIRRFRDLDMPLEQIQAVLSAPDLMTRNERISAHLARLEVELGRTQCAVSSLRNLLSPGVSQQEPRIELRSLPATPAAAITDIVDAASGSAWSQGALGELTATLHAQQLQIDGPPGGIFGDSIFTEHLGQATIFLPCTGEVRPIGRVVALEIPAVEMAIIEHAGSPADVDQAYGALAEFVSRHALAVDGPLREYYLVGRRDTSDTARWRTEVGWPVFRTTVPSVR